MTYNAFKSAAIRADSSSNDNVHFFSKHLSTPVAYFCYKLGLTPNQITLLFGVVGCLSGVLLYLKMPILAYLFWRLHIVLDMADGSVARATENFSTNAKGFDRSNHIIINTTILLAPLSGGGPLFVGNALIVAFYLYYFFSRNYELEQGSVRHFKVSANIVKNLVGLEGYVLATGAAIWFDAYFLIVPIAAFYTFTFVALFLLKIHIRISE